MSHIVLEIIENNTEKVKRQFSHPFSLLNAESFLRNKIDVVRHIIIYTKESIDERLVVSKSLREAGFNISQEQCSLSA